MNNIKKLGDSLGFRTLSPIKTDFNNKATKFQFSASFSNTDFKSISFRKTCDKRYKRLLVESLFTEWMVNAIIPPKDSHVNLTVLMIHCASVLFHSLFKTNRNFTLLRAWENLSTGDKAKNRWEIMGYRWRGFYVLLQCSLKQQALWWALRNRANIVEGKFCRHAQSVVFTLENRIQSFFSYRNV